MCCCLEPLLSFWNWSRLLRENGKPYKIDMISISVVMMLQCGAVTNHKANVMNFVSIIYMSQPVDLSKDLSLVVIGSRVCR